MKKTLILMLCAVVLLALSACGGDAPADALQTPSQGAAEALPNRSAPPAAPYDPAQSSQADTGAAPAVSGAEAFDEEPFGQYRSVEELLAILDGTAEDDRAEPAYSEPPEQLEIDGEESYGGGSVSTQFSDEGWEEPAVTIVELEMVDENGNPIEDFESAVAAGGEAPDAAGPGETLPDGTGAADDISAGLPPVPGETMSQLDGGAYFAMGSASADEYRSYIEALKAAGFNVDAHEENMSDFGIAMDTFSASHSDGRYVTVTYMDGQLIVELTEN